MREIVDIALSDLLLDPQNARLETHHEGQAAIALALAKQQGSKLIQLASDIMEHGTDPTALPAVLATDDRKKRYVVLEGNRRLLALKGLDTPNLVAPALRPAERRRLSKLADKYSSNPTETITCVLFESKDEALHWIELRHTGENRGSGLVSWGSDEQDRFAARYGQRTPARQLLDFVHKHGSLSNKACKSKRRIITNVARLISTPEVRTSLGIDLIEGKLYTCYPTEEVITGLSKVVDDLLTGSVQVPHIYHARDRRLYIQQFNRSELPQASTILSKPKALDSITFGLSTPETPPKRHKRKSPTQRPRTTLIPSSCNLDISTPRINSIYLELSQLNIERYPNVAAIGLRVFLEQTVDHYIAHRSLMTDNQLRNTALAKRLKVAAKGLRANGDIARQLEVAIIKVADSSQLVAASMITMNQYVHNAYTLPSSVDLRIAWDELQPFVESMWVAS